MIEYCSNAWGNFLDWKEDLSQQNSEWLDTHWDYYIQDRAIFKGLPIAMIGSIAASRLFNCAKPSIAVLFAIVNYLTLTSLSEIIRMHHDIDKTKACVILGISGAITLGFIQTVCKTTMTYQAVVVLAVAAFGGQLARQFFAQDQ